MIFFDSSHRELRGIFCGVQGVKVFGSQGTGFVAVGHGMVLFPFYRSLNVSVVAVFFSGRTCRIKFKFLVHVN